MSVKRHLYRLQKLVIFFQILLKQPIYRLRDTQHSEYPSFKYLKFKGLLLYFLLFFFSLTLFPLLFFLHESGMFHVFQLIIVKKIWCNLLN